MPQQHDVGTGSREAVRAFTLRRTAAAATGAAAVLLCWASLSWACGLYSAVPAASVTPNRAAAAAPVTVSGTGWQPDGAVALSLSTDGSTVLAPLGAPVAKADGTFSLDVRLGDAPSGVYYVTAIQGSTHTNTPIEITGRGGSGPAHWPAVGSGSSSPSLTGSGHDAPTGSGFPWAAVLVAGGVLAGCGLLGASELRRQRARS